MVLRCNPWGGFGTDRECGHSWRAMGTRFHTSSISGCGHPVLGGGEVLGRWEGCLQFGVCW